MTDTRRGIVSKICDKTNFTTRDVAEILDALIDEMMKILSAGGRIEFRNFGVFEVVTTKQKVGRNPKNPMEEVVIPVRRRVKFKTGKMLKDLLKDGQNGRK